jgi:hypothetical protein
MPSLVDINEKNKMILKELAKADCYDKKENYIIAHIFQVELDGYMSKADFMDKTFLRKINPLYYYEKGLFYKHRYIQSISMICKNDTSYFGNYKNTNGIWCSNETPEILAKKTKIAKIILNPETAMVLQLGSLNDFIVVKYSGEVDILIYYDDPISIYPLKDYIENHWEEFLGYGWSHKKKQIHKDSLTPNSLNEIKK